MTVTSHEGLQGIGAHPTPPPPTFTGGERHSLCVHDSVFPISKVCHIPYSQQEVPLMHNDNQCRVTAQQLGFRAEEVRKLRNRVGQHSQAIAALRRDLQRANGAGQLAELERQAARLADQGRRLVFEAGRLQ